MMMSFEIFYSTSGQMFYQCGLKQPLVSLLPEIINQVVYILNMHKIIEWCR